MFLSGVEESAAIAEFGDSGGLSKNGGRPVASVRSGGASDPKAADVRRRRREKAGRETDSLRCSGNWQGRAGTHATLYLQSPASSPSSPLHAQKLRSCSVKNTYNTSRETEGIGSAAEKGLAKFRPEEGSISATWRGAKRLR